MKKISGCFKAAAFSCFSVCINTICVRIERSCLVRGKLGEKLPSGKEISAHHDDSGKKPGDRVDQAESRKLVMGADDGKDPDQSESTGTDDGDDHRNNGFTHTAQTSAGDLVCADQKMRSTGA